MPRVLSLMLRPVAMVCLAGFLGSTAEHDAWAQSRDDQLDKLMRCDAIKKRSKRRDCIDDVLAEMRSARGRSAPAPRSDDRSADDVASREFAKERSARPVDPKKGFRARLLSVKENSVGRHYFMLDNGQVWREKTPSQITFVSKKTEFVEIKRGALSGWRITFDTSKQKGAVERVK